MKILFVASEANPLVKVGGLADVIGSLPVALTKRGHDVRLMIPKYGSIDTSQYPMTTVRNNFKIQIMGKTEPVCLMLTTIKDEVPVYMIESSQYFGNREVYGKNDQERFLFFSKAVSEILPQLDWQPEVIHCHDWHTSLLVMWLKKSLYPSASIFTIHNLAYQGSFDEAFLVRAGLERDWRDYPPDAPRPLLNFMSQGILWADLVTTVSATYAKEILTSQYGEGLDSLLRYRQKDLLGIVNGIDYTEYSPETDKYIPSNYDSSTPERRVANKLALQKRSGLPPDTRIPLIGMVQRLDEQKGFDILEKALSPILEETKAQLVILGRGREYYENMLRQIAAKYPEQVALSIAFDNPLAHLIYAGCDMFLMPSRFEPCGLGQLIAMHYGALPIVRHTGGLVDTVQELTPDLTQGSGFVFRDYASAPLIAAVERGVDSFKNQKTWNPAMQRVMRLDFSWQASATRYETAYQQVLEARKHLPM
ncbi:MAG: glycogen synthase [Dehalococcoidales bacterium]|nr:glycogen synthase [Dehalococcoidales bacterium]